MRAIAIKRAPRLLRNETMDQWLAQQWSLRVGTRAIKAHISALLAMCGLESRTQLALLASAGGLMPPARS